MGQTGLKGRSSLFEIIISGIAAALCLATTVLIWISLASVQGIWLLPGAYFLELMAGAGVCFWAFYRGYPQASLLSWIYSGVLVVFIVLAGFSIGFLYLPIFILFAGLSIFSDIKHKQPMLAHLGVFLAAGVLQLGVMLAVIWVSSL